jgi:hypothetical protein
VSIGILLSRQLKALVLNFNSECRDWLEFTSQTEFSSSAFLDASKFVYTNNDSYGQQKRSPENRSKVKAMLYIKTSGTGHVKNQHTKGEKVYTS